MSEPRPPAPDEYDAYYRPYVERVVGSDLFDTLRAQRGELLTLIDGLDEERALRRYEPGKWSVKEVVGHLVDTERVFAFRALSVARGEAQELPGFEQDDYVAAGSFDERPLESLAAEYGSVRASTVALFEGLPPAAWSRRGVANDAPVTVRALAWIVAGHQAHHAAILRERYGVAE